MNAFCVLGTARCLQRRKGSLIFEHLLRERHFLGYHL